MPASATNVVTAQTLLGAMEFEMRGALTQDPASQVFNQLDEGNYGQWELFDKVSGCICNSIPTVQMNLDFGVSLSGSFHPQTDLSSSGSVHMISDYNTSPSGAKTEVNQVLSIDPVAGQTGVYRFQATIAGVGGGAGGGGFPIALSSSPKLVPFHESSTGQTTGGKDTLTGFGRVTMTMLLKYRAEPDFTNHGASSLEVLGTGFQVTCDWSYQCTVCETTGSYRTTQP